MSTEPRPTTSPDHVVLAKQRIARLLFLLALTAMNAWVIVDAAPVLYHASTGHPFGFMFVTLMFGVLLVSLLRVWFVTFLRIGR